MSPIRVGIIGCGNIAHSHVLRMSRLEEVRIVALADPGAGSRAFLKEKFGLDQVQEFDSHTDMLNDTELDAVVICSPHTLHYGHIRDSLSAGKHVLVEKPMTCSSAEAERLIALSESCGKVLQVSFQRHFLPPFLYIRSAIQDGTIGKLTSVQAALYQNWKKSQEGTWRQNPALSGGGMLMDSGSHIIDVLLWTTNLTPQSVTVQLECYGSPVEVDTLTSIRYDQGVIGTMTIIGYAPLQKLKETYAFIGESGGIFYDNGVITLHRYGEDPVQPRLPEAETDPDSSFVDAILGRREVMVSGEYALKVVKFTEAIYEAAGYEPGSADRTDLGRKVSS
ncbi:Gfo/Idh/MocA family protein [Paenibacillus oceani]|uniref:Gfo/Idh/MocA family oxidoreductase n=1 Tax=Paenibacillus oceani TaxID=2772510 RepID=A0A927GY45_9BACL|nr:Gfo/Idh/MocA family oxidoreductase [Paenibacillus oceani]MBD2861215.1 Gfo/Idh/MocA family oxidoreductase [Paenibacillus oceani]